MTGKSTYLNLVAKVLLKKRVVLFNPKIIGNYRELYGIYDPFTTT